MLRREEEKDGVNDGGVDIKSILARIEKENKDQVKINETEKSSLL